MANFPADPIPIYPVKEQIEFKTLVSEAELPYRQKRSAWGNISRRIWNLQYNHLIPAKINILWNFYVARRGAFESFTFNNPNDGQNYTASFAQDGMSKEQFVYQLYTTGLEIIQEI